jgi:hypothetical protein
MNKSIIVIYYDRSEDLCESWKSNSMVSTCMRMISSFNYVSYFKDYYYLMYKLFVLLIYIYLALLIISLIYCYDFKNKKTSIKKANKTLKRYHTV